MNYVYYCHEADGRLVYVGATFSLLERFNKHRYETPWWPRVASVRTVSYPTRAEAFTAEAEAILRLRPPHNKLIPGDLRYH